MKDNKFLGILTIENKGYLSIDEEDRKESMRTLGGNSI